jgi:hypothetical protein
MTDTWFSPKSFGYGATPSNWKGWVATLGFVALMLGWSLGVLGTARQSPVPWTDWVLWFAGASVFTAAFIALAKRKTDGEWKWRGWDRGQ